MNWGDVYSTAYVRRLEAGVKRHLSLPHKFECIWFTNFKLPREGCWPKLELFRLIDGPTLYLDLDTVIVGSLDWVREHCEKPVSMAPVSGRYEGQHVRHAAVMTFSGESVADFYDDLTPQDMRTYQNDEHYIPVKAGDRLGALPEGKVVSWRWACRGKSGPPEGASIVSVHGDPKPHQIKNDPTISRHWIE